MTVHKKKSTAPRSLLEAGDHVMPSSPLFDPAHWFPGKVLWTDGIEVLVEQYGIAYASPQKQLHSVDYVRAFGTSEHCRAEKARAEKAVRDAARECDEVQEMAAELRRKLIDLFETVAVQAIAASQEGRARPRSAARSRKASGDALCP